jgi:hypothetical protein
MARRTQRYHQLQLGNAWHPMMDGQLAAFQIRAPAASAAVSLQNRFAQSTVIFLILPFHRVTARTETKCENLLIPAGLARMTIIKTRHIFAAPLEELDTTIGHLAKQRSDSHGRTS